MREITMTTITYKDLMKFGYKEHTARSVIAQAKQYMVKCGYPFYNNKRLGAVPASAVERIVGFSLTQESEKNHDS